MKGTKSNQDRDTYLEVDFKQTGTYYVLLETEEVSTVTDNIVEFYALNSYGQEEIEFEVQS
jgi:hypothetical protein